MGDEGVHHRLDRGGGNGEAQALHRIVIGPHFQVGNANHLSPVVDERPAGVARVEGGGGLEQYHGVPVHVHIPVDGGDDAVGHGAPQLLPQRIADGRHRVPHLQKGGVTELGGRQAGAVDLQHRQIALCILSHQQGLEHTLILEHHIHGAASLNDVAVGDDIPVLRHHHAGAQAHAVPLAPPDADDGGDVLPVNLLEAVGPAAGQGGDGEGGAVPGGGPLYRGFLRQLLPNGKGLPGAVGQGRQLLQAAVAPQPRRRSQAAQQGHGQEKEEHRRCAAPPPAAPCGNRRRGAPGGLPRLIVIVAAHGPSFLPRLPGRHASVRVNTNSVTPSWLVTEMFSLWLLRIVLTIYSPRPTPSRSMERE